MLGQSWKLPKYPIGCKVEVRQVIHVNSEVLTDNVECYKITPDGLSADLTFVNSCIALLGPFNLQNPLVSLSVVVGLEALVAGVRVASHGQDVDVSMSNPRHLQFQQAISSL